MALKLSSGLVTNMMGKVAALKAFLSGATLAYSDNGASPDTITHSGNGFISAGFAPGDLIWTKNPTTGGNALSGVALTAVEAGTITMATGTLAASEAFPEAGCVLSCTGGSLKDLFKDGVIRIYSGTIPATADAAITGTLLAEISVGSLAFTPGSFDNGLEFGDAVLGVIAKATGETWSGVASATGTATHYRFVGNATDAGALSTVLPRIQGTVGVGTSYDLNISSTSITAAETVTISSFSYTLSPS